MAQMKGNGNEQQFCDQFQRDSIHDRRPTANWDDKGKMLDENDKEENMAN